MPDRGYITWNPYSKNRALLEEARAVFEEYAAYRPLTVRQVFYRLVGRGVITKNDARTVEGLLQKARRARQIPFEWVRDDGVVALLAGGYRDAQERIEELRADWQCDIRLDRQAEQDPVLEVWVEAAGMVPQVERVARAYSVPVYSGGGFRSITASWEAARRVAEGDTDVLILQIGDFDADGVMITTSFAEDVAAFAKEDGEHAVKTQRIALTEEQARDYDLPAEAVVVPTDPRKRENWLARYGWWLDRHGPRKWQAEALPPDVLAGIVRSAIEERLDMETYNAQLAREDEENETLAEWRANLEQGPFSEEGE